MEGLVIQVELVTATTRHLPIRGDDGDSDAADRALKAFEAGRPPYNREFLETVEGDSVARAHVVRASLEVAPPR